MQITGSVTKSRPYAGSFRKITVNDFTYILGICQDLNWPKVGERISVSYEDRCGRRCAEHWERV